MAHVDDVIIIILVIVPVPVLNHLVLFKAGALAIAALIGGVRPGRVSQLFIAGLFYWLDSAPRLPPDDHGSPQQKHQHDRGGDQQSCLGALRGRPRFMSSKDAFIHAVLAVTALLAVGGVTTVETAAIVHVQQQGRGAHGAVLGARPLAFHAALVAFFTVEFLSLSHSVFSNKTVGGADAPHEVIAPHTG